MSQSLSGRRPVVRACVQGAIGLLLIAGYADVACSVETPVSYGEAARVDTPVLRISRMAKPPVIDGVMSPGEWEDCSALSGFWYDYAQADFRFLAAIQTQLQVSMAYDDENLYVAFSSPVYPKNSWLKARGRFPDVLGHPLYGTLWDDHHEFELRPFNDMVKGFQLGLLRLDVNPIGTLVDWYWSITGGEDMTWQSGARIGSQTDGNRWVVEISLPFAAMRYGNYAGVDAQGQSLVKIPPPDGTIYRSWLVRGIGGNGGFFNAFDNHIWNTTKTQIIFDSKAPSFQINELGPIMEDIIDLRLTVKNHNSRSETVQLGFFVENASGTVYSSYQSPELKDGLLELVPGEVKTIRLRQPFPGITQEGNVLWFDVRSAGRPGKQLFRTRLIQFHSMEGGNSGGVTYKARRLDNIQAMRPPRKDFDFRWTFSPYTKRISAQVDRGIHGASEEVQKAREAKLSILTGDTETVVREVTVPFRGAFACCVVDLPELKAGQQYEVSLLLFDENKRIVGEQAPEPFTYSVEPWMNNQIGLDDVVWEPFTAIVKTDTGFTTLKHRFTLDPSGLPAQIDIRPDPRELPLGKRGADAKIEAAELLALGRGPQLRRPMRLEAVVDGRRVGATVLEPAKVVRQWKSEIVYASHLQVGPLDVTLTTRYDCDGALHCSMTYGSAKPATVERFELVTDVDGTVDLTTTLQRGGGGMTGSDVWEMSLPEREGVIWDSFKTRFDLFAGKFVPFTWFGNEERGWTWYCDSDRGWYLDKESSSMQLERDAQGKITWRVQFVNSKAEVGAARQIDFAILTHPAKPKPANFRRSAWHYQMGEAWADGYQVEPIELSDDYLKARWHTAASAPKDLPWEKAATWRKDEPPYHRYGRWRNAGVCDELDREWEDKATYYMENHIRVGRRVGWWMDEYWPIGFGRSDNIAAGYAYLRDPATVAANELPYQSGFLTTYMRDTYKRLARVSAANNVPQRQFGWSNNEAQFLESFMYSSLLVEECGAGNRSFDLDSVTQYPNSLYRYIGKNGTGLVTTLTADATFIVPGDDPRPDRQLFGRALLNDFGVTLVGPHGHIENMEQAARVLSRLDAFGFFKDADIEKLPFWRNAEYVRIGDKPSGQSKVYVTVYRRPLENGKGFKALFVLMNESDAAVTLPLTIADPRRVLGGPSTLKAGEVRNVTPMPEALRQWWGGLTGRAAGEGVLEDLETGEVISRAESGGQTYGPVHIPYHDYRLLYGQWEGAP